MALYIKVLLKGNSAGNYTVPAGKAAIVKSMRFVDTGGGGGQVTVTAASLTVLRKTLSANENLLDVVEFNLEANSTLSVSVPTAVDYFISGVERDI